VGITLSSVLPYLLVAGGYVLRHYQVGSKLLAFLGLNAPVASTSGTVAAPSPAIAPVKQVLSDAVHAAVNKAAADAASNHIVSLKDELKATVEAAIAAAVADLKAAASAPATK